MELKMQQEICDLGRIDVYLAPLLEELDEVDAARIVRGRLNDGAHDAILDRRRRRDGRRGQ